MRVRFLLPVIAIVLYSLSHTAQADGQSTYAANCGSCHGGGFKGMMARAPKTGKDKAWKKYFSVSVEESKSKVFDGTGKHKGMGTEANLTLEEVSAAVDYILSKTNIGK